MENQRKSDLKKSDIEFHHSPTSNTLPPGSDFLEEAKATNIIEQAQLVYSINPELDLKSEGYILDINVDQVQINAKDQAGLIYGLATLEQLMEDAGEQGVKLPLCHIKDYPYSPTVPFTWTLNTTERLWIITIV